MKRLLPLLLSLAVPFVGQEQKSNDFVKGFPPEPKPSEGPVRLTMIQKLFILKYAEPSRMQSLLGVFGASVRTDNDLHAIAVSASETAMAGIEDAIKRLDIPSAIPQNVELIAYYVVGGPDENTAGGALSKDLESVITQLRNTFPFKNYKLLDTVTLRTRTGQNADTTGTVSGANQPVTITNFRIGSATVAADGNTVRIDKMKVGVRLPVPTGLPGPGAPVQFTYQDLGLNADVDIKEGQKVVVGRVGMSRDQALFLVLTARVVN